MHSGENSDGAAKGKLMSQVEIQPELNFLSELYVQDAPQARLLAEYPSSNSTETEFQNRSKYIIHDPFPPPRRELIKVLGPHHLMCGWGRRLDVTSEIAPRKILLDHWEKTFGIEGRPNWQPFAANGDYITLFPHESLAAPHQVIDPEVNYAIHSKEVIANIDCPQADVLDAIVPPCIVKLSHGYAGLGNFMIQEASDEVKMHTQLTAHWPDATLVINSIIGNVTDDFGVQFYLRRNGSIVWLGLTEQLFDKNKRWRGGMFSDHLQTELFDDLCRMIEPAAQYLHGCGYFGLVGIDILRNESKQLFLVDVNPRLTGISPFLMASRIFARDLGLSKGIYQASCQFSGSLEQLIGSIEEIQDAKVVVLSAFEETIGEQASTLCHLSVTSDSQGRNQQILKQLLQS